MKLMTKEIERKLEKAGFYPPEDKPLEGNKVIVKYFNPCGAGTWLITEGEKQEDGDWLFYGYCYLFEWEWGYVMLSELENVTLPFGLKIERERYVTGGKVKDYI